MPYWQLQDENYQLSAFKYLYIFFKRYVIFIVSSVFVRDNSTNNVAKNLELFVL